MKYPAVEIRIILSSSSSRHSDHVITVKSMPNSYVWGYNDPTVSTYHVLELVGVDAVLNQFDILVNGLTFDVDPYRCLQFNVPALPPLMVEVRDLRRHVNSIKNMLRNALLNVPQSMTEEEITEFMDDDEMEAEADDEAEEADDEAEEEDVYADLPPLISLDESPPTHRYFTRLQERLQTLRDATSHTYFS